MNLGASKNNRYCYVDGASWYRPDRIDDDKLIVNPCKATDFHFMKITANIFLKQLIYMCEKII